MKVTNIHMSELGLFPTIDLNREYDLKMDRLYHPVE